LEFLQATNRWLAGFATAPVAAALYRMAIALQRFQPKKIQWLPELLTGSRLDPPSAFALGPVSRSRKSE
jgi:hypothetical protein